jgi:hypothetical protein
MVDEPSFPGVAPMYFSAIIVDLYIVANFAKFRAWVRVALKMRLSFSWMLRRVSP